MANLILEGMELEAHLIEEETIQYPAIKAYLRSNSEVDLDKAII